jgi:hypothetical protein
MPVFPEYQRTVTWQFPDSAVPYEYIRDNRRSYEREIKRLNELFPKLADAAIVAIDECAALIGHSPSWTGPPQRCAELVSREIELVKAGALSHPYFPTVQAAVRQALPKYPDCWIPGQWGLGG